MEPLEPYLIASRTLSQDAFQRQCASPVLVFTGLAAAPQPDPKGMGFKTQLSQKRSLSEEALQDSSSMSLHEVHPLVKHGNSAYSDRVSVGRTRTSDIQLPYPQISKFHAYFTWTEDKKQYFLVDAGSANGTFVADKIVPKGERVQLQNDVLVAFGPYRFFFFEADAFYRFLGTLRG